MFSEQKINIQSNREIGKSCRSIKSSKSIQFKNSNEFERFTYEKENKIEKNKENDRSVKQSSDPNCCRIMWTQMMILPPSSVIPQIYPQVQILNIVYNINPCLNIWLQITDSNRLSTTMRKLPNPSPKTSSPSSPRAPDPNLFSSSPSSENNQN